MQIRKAHIIAWIPLGVALDVVVISLYQYFIGDPPQLIFTFLSFLWAGIFIALIKTYKSQKFRQVP